ncbi:MAG: hypothetical protein DHS20C11_17310 [Lysobacteraceae bacterium]|nr:MAG: hypothetical protein DHS20C11_17310 [Xanthomonadaceae bacterium]
MAYRFGRDTIVWDLDTGAIGFETPDGHVAGIGDATAVRFSKDADFLVYSQNSRTQIRNRMSGLVEMVGIDTSGEIVDSSDPDVSADGRYVVFREYDFSLVHPHKIMVRDRALAQTQFVAADDALAGTDPYARPRISSDGQTVYFLSRYPLIPPGGNGFIALYARDLKDAEIELLSVNPYGMPTIGDTIDFAISENARIAFASLAPDQVAGFEGSGLNIFLIDRIANTKEVISGVTHAGQTGYDLELGGFATNTKEVSAKSRARMVGDQDANVVRDTYVLSVNSPPELVSKSYIDGTAAGGFSSDISSDGRFVAFGSIGEDITNDDVEAFWGQIYLMDRHTGDVELVSYDHDFPSQGANQWTSTASISPDGRFVGFKTDASNLTEHPIFSQTACLVRDTHTGEIFEQLGAADPWQVSECHGNKLTNSGLFSTIEGQRQLFFQDITLDQYWHLGNEPPGSWGDSYTGEAHATPDGELVVFRSNIDDLVENDLNGFSDIFLWFRDTDEFTRLSTGVGETEPNGHSAAPDISDDGRFVVYESLASNLVSRDRNNASDVFLLDRATGMTERLSLTNQSQELAAGSFGPRITGDGKFVVFSTSARSVGPGVSNHATDIFIVPNLNLYHEPNARDDIFPVTIGQQFSDNVISPESGTPDFVYRGGQLSVIEINGNPNIVGQPVELTSGTITLHVDGSFSYASTRAPVMPIENEDTFTYTVEDSMGSTSSALVTIYLTQSNAMPVATDDNLSSILEDQQIAIPSESLLDNDHAGEVDDEVIISDVWPITGGEPILVANGVVFKPVDNFNGPAEFGYSIQDQAAQENSAVVRFDVIPVNDPPLIHAADQVFATGIVQSIVDQSWLSLSKPGPANEDDSQEITGYQLLSTDDPDGILQSLDISTEGHLSYQTTGNGGAAVAWFVAMDDGGSLDGGVDQTEPVAVELYAVPGDDLAITASVVDNTVEPFQVAELLIEVNRANGGSLYGTWVEVVADGIPGTYSATSCASYSVVCYETETGFVIANTNFETTETVQYLQAEPSVVGERIPISVTVGVPYGSVDQNLQNNVVEIPLQLGIFVDGFE